METPPGNRTCHGEFRRRAKAAQNCLKPLPIGLHPPLSTREPPRSSILYLFGSRSVSCPNNGGTSASSLTRFRCLFGATNLLLLHLVASMTSLRPVLYYLGVTLVRPCQPEVILRRAACAFGFA